MKRLALTILAVFSTAIVTVIGTPGASMAAALPTFVSPADGSSVAEFTDQLTLDFPEAGTFSIEVYNDAGTYDWSATPTVSAGTQTWDIDPLTPPGSYHIYVYDTDTLNDESADFTVSGPPVRLTQVSAGPSTFYPVVRDGYKDSTRVSYRLNRRANVTAHVHRRSDGATIRTIHVGTQSQGRRAFTWNGRTNGGHPVKAGRYRVALTATDTDGHRASAGVTVEAVTAVVNRSRTISRTGDHTTTTAHSRSCYVTHYYYIDETDLDCWGGRFAQASYRFALPASAHNLTFHVRGDQGCCSGGTITKTGDRLTRRSYRVLVKVTKWRAYDVYGVRISYAYRVHI